MHSFCSVHYPCVNYKFIQTIYLHTRERLVDIMSKETDEKLMGEQDSISILGISWNFNTDEFQFKAQNRKQPNADVKTKRIITSEAARVFDPQGYLAPYHIRAKLYIQELWCLGVN